MSLKLSIQNEYSDLRSVYMLPPTAFNVTPPINKVQERWFYTNPPKHELMAQEQQAFAQTLMDYGVNIVWGKADKSMPQAHDTRDAGAVIGDKFVIGRMRKKIRLNEPTQALKSLNLPEESTIELKSGYLEGGDIVVDENHVFVGLSDRTDLTAAEELKKALPEHQFEFIRLAPGVLHLDTVLVLLPHNLALIYRPAIETLPSNLTDKYSLIDMSHEEFERVALNVFCINPQTIVADSQNSALIGKLRQYGFNVTGIDFSQTVRNGGSFRCGTLPLCRSV